MSHRSVRKFAPIPVAQAVVEQLVQAGQASATSSFLQVTTVIQVDDISIREKLYQISGNQPYVAKCPVFLVFCADFARNSNICQQQGISMPEGYTEHTLIAAIDTGIFAQTLMLCAESLGLGGVYIGGLRNDPQGVTDALDLPQQIAPLFGMCLGYPDHLPEQKPRLPLPNVLHHNRYSPYQQANIDAYDQQVLGYYKTSRTDRGATRFSDHIATTLGKEARPHMFEFMQRQGMITR